MKKFLTALLVLVWCNSFANLTTLSFSHQSSFVEKTGGYHKANVNLFSIADFSEEDSLLCNVAWSQFYNSEFMMSAGIGFRQHVDLFSFGMNAFWDFSNRPFKISNQIGLGLEFFFEDLILSFNNYLPIEKSAGLNGDKVIYHKASEVNVCYFLNPDWMLELSPVYVHKSSEWRIHGAVAYRGFPGIDISLLPGYGSLHGKMGEIRLTYYWGIKPKLRRHEKIRRFEKIHFRKAHKPLKKSSNKKEMVWVFKGAA